MIRKFSLIEQIWNEKLSQYSRIKYSLATTMLNDPITNLLRMLINGNGYYNRDLSMFAKTYEDDDLRETLCPDPRQ